MKSKYSIEVTNLSKKYRLGSIGMGSLRDDLNQWWNKDKKSPHITAGEKEESIGLLNKNEFWALNDVHFSFERGDVVGIVGKNGSGKSTLLKILSRITEPTCGEARIRGKVASLLEVGTGFHPELTGRENVYINGAILGMTRGEVDKKFDEIIDFSGVQDFVDTPVKRYSSGMTVRLGFAVAAHLDPDLLIVDEVLAVGDLSFQNKCIKKMQSIAASGKTIFFVSHNNALLRKLCTKGILLKKGKVFSIGEINQVLDHYTNDQKTAFANGGQIDWMNKKEAPGDSRLRLVKAHIKEVGSDTPTRLIKIDQDYEVSIVYENLIPNSKYLVSLKLENKNRLVLLTSSNTESYSIQKDYFCLTPLKRGLYKSTCIFPGKLFNAGIYYISLYIVENDIHNPVIENLQILEFEIVETLYMREDYFGKNIGLLKFKQSWQTRPLC